MKVVILCGGLGTRLREETEYRPKPLVNVGGKPILWHIMKTVPHGLSRVLCLGYQGEMIRDYFINYDLLNSDFTIQLGTKQIVTDHVIHDEAKWRVSLVDTRMLTQTRRLARIRKYIGADEDFLVTYGDGVAISTSQRSSSATATVVGLRRDGRASDRCVRRADGRGSRYDTSPRNRRRATPGSTAAIRTESRVFDTSTGSCVLERSPLERLSAEGQLGVYRHPGRGSAWTRCATWSS